MTLSSNSLPSFLPEYLPSVLLTSFLKRRVLYPRPHFYRLAGEKILRPSHFVKYRRLNFFIFEFFLLFPVLCALLHIGNFLFVQNSYISYTKICYKIFRSKTGKSKNPKITLFQLRFLGKQASRFRYNFTTG